MQSLAAEMNLSETAFVEPVRKDFKGQAQFQQGSVFNLRWFTPETEAPLCGHATLASAAVLIQGEVAKHTKLVSMCCNLHSSLMVLLQTKATCRKLSTLKLLVAA